MNYHRFFYNLGATALILAPVLGNASGIHSLDVVTPYAATAGAGHATDTGITASYNNPAGLGWLQNPGLYLGVTVLNDSMKYKDHGSTGPDMEHRKKDLDYSMGVTPIPSLFYAAPVNDKLAYSLSLAGMAGGAGDYGTDWVGSAFVNATDVKVMGLSTGLGYSLNDSWSVGMTVGAAYLVWELDVELPMPNSTNSIELDDIKPYWQLGLMYQPIPGTRLGLRYMSKVDFSATGDANMNINDHAIVADARMNLNLPNMLSFSIGHQLTENVTLLSDIKWSEWSSFKENKLQQTGGGLPDVTMVIDRNWHNTWGGAIGVTYQLNDEVNLKSGISYEASPVHFEDHKLDPPMDRQVRYAVGLTYAPKDTHWNIDLSYQHLDLGDVEVSQAIPDPSNPIYVVNGSSQADVRILNLALSYQF